MNRIFRLKVKSLRYWNCLFFHSPLLRSFLFLNVQPNILCTLDVFRKRSHTRSNFTRHVIQIARAARFSQFKTFRVNSWPPKLSGVHLCSEGTWWCPVSRMSGGLGLKKGSGTIYKHSFHQMTHYILIFMIFIWKTLIFLLFNFNLNLPLYYNEIYRIDTLAMTFSCILIDTNLTDLPTWLFHNWLFLLSSRTK